MLYAPAALHLPDGFLSLPVSVLCWAMTILLVGTAIARTNRSFGERQVPLMGLMAAFIFAAQMITFPVPGGASGHLLGGTLAAILLGPWGGMLVMTAVIALQALIFQDGGLLVMGANILNMGILTAAAGYGLYRAAAGWNRKAKLGMTAAASWLSVMTGALFTSLEMWLSGTAKLELVLPAMLIVHALTGLGEALITTAALAFILRSRPDLLGEASASMSAGRGWIAAGALVTLIVLLITPLASADPDGLNRVAQELGFIQTAGGVSGPFAGYSFPGLAASPLGRIAAGALGAAVVLGAGLLIGRSLRPADSRHSEK